MDLRTLQTKGAMQDRLDGSRRRLAEGGKYTKVIYSLIRDRNYEESVHLLSRELRTLPTSRAALSLLGYCNYQCGNFRGAATIYEQLCFCFPDVQEYHLYRGLCSQKLMKFSDADKFYKKVTAENLVQHRRILESSLKYESDELSACRNILQLITPPSQSVAVIKACILYKEGSFNIAGKMFLDAMSNTEINNSLGYNIALCFYRQGQFGHALNHLSNVIESGVREHPELSVGSGLDGLEMRSVGNSSVLKMTTLVEAFNLKAAIEFEMNNERASREALLDMPPRLEDELDPVTLHNQAILNMDATPAEGFKKLQYLLGSQFFPPETLQNLLLSYLKHGYLDLAADVMAENNVVLEKFLDTDLRSFLAAAILMRESPEVAYAKFDELASRKIDDLRKFTKHIQDSRMKQDNESVKKFLSEYDVALESYIPVLMYMGKIYWDMSNYSMVEKIFRQSAELCSDHEIWRLNVAHTFFMQESKFKEAIRYYEPIVQENRDKILEVPAIVLANLCVAYIMTSQNEDAEELMRKIEKAEELKNFENDGKAIYHLCIVNLVIGTLYCSKGNYDFGISRIIKSLEPYSRKLGPDTWFYAKRCFLGLFDAKAKYIITVQDSTVHEMLQFFDAAEFHGREIYTFLGDSNGTQRMSSQTVSTEARALKYLCMKF